MSDMVEQSAQSSSSELDELLDVKEAAEYLGGISHHTLYRWSSEGKVPYEKRGRKKYFTRRMLDEWRAAQRQVGH